MIEAQVPEFAEGGYWYVLPTTTDARGNTVPEGLSRDMCCYYVQIDGQLRAVVRAPYLAAVPTAPVEPGRAISLVPNPEGGKPKFRVQGQ